jgi:hypothetical protein
MRVKFKIYEAFRRFLRNAFRIFTPLNFTSSGNHSGTSGEDLDQQSVKGDYYDFRSTCYKN